MGALPEITLGEFLAELRAEERRLPIQGTLETTFRCNLRCVHCYVNEAAGDRVVEEREASTGRLLRLVDEIVEAGCLELLLTGGEVLLRRDFAEVYVHAVRSGLRVTVFTNGTMITDAVADLLDRYRPKRVEITLYGMTRETYEKVTGVPGSYDRCREGIRRIHERGIPLRLKTMAMTWNLEEVPAMRAFAEELGVPFQHDGLLNPRVDCGASRKGELQLRPEQVVALDLADPERARRLREACDALRDAEPPADDFVYSCGAARNNFTVDPYATLQPCQLSRRNGVDIREKTFEYGWTGSLAALVQKRWQTDGVCRRCRLMAVCGSCAGAAEMEHGDAEAVVSEFCRITHLRAFTAASQPPQGHRADATCCLGGGPAVPEPLIRLEVRRPATAAGTLR
jgi:radical SAM protein with 4Fe4S-binding SPASM domain